MDPDVKRTIRGVQILRDRVCELLQLHQLPAYCNEPLHKLLASLDNATMCAETLEAVLERGDKLKAGPCIPIPQAPEPEQLFSWDRHESEHVLRRKIADMKEKLTKM